jgi:hypothetical protein
MGATGGRYGIGLLGVHDIGTEQCRHVYDLFLNLPAPLSPRAPRL